MKAMKIRTVPPWRTLYVEGSEYSSGRVVIALDSDDPDELPMSVHLTPAQARRVAKALMKFAEGK